MPDLADLYPGFQSHWVDTSAGKLFARTGGKGPPLLLLHGYAQTHVMWHRVAPALAEHFSLVIADLPGYGWSSVPEAGPDHAPYDKRSMGKAMVELMEKLGHIRFRLAGHDRGGRVAYRLALDHPHRLEKLSTLDIIPTYDMWHGIDAKLAFRIWHWTFLAQPAPFPETIIGRDPVDFWNRVKAKSIDAFDPRATAHYRAFFSDPLRIHATCEDYRAGRTTDFTNDEADRAAGKKIECPMLALWGATGLPSNAQDGPLATWQQWAKDVRGLAINCGHFMPEEHADAVSKALIEFFK
jgi:haloacetate dehalogenase